MREAPIENFQNFRSEEIKEVTADNQVETSIADESDERTDARFEGKFCVFVGDHLPDECPDHRACDDAYWSKEESGYKPKRTPPDTPFGASEFFGEPDRQKIICHKSCRCEQDKHEQLSAGKLHLVCEVNQNQSHKGDRNAW